MRQSNWNGFINELDRIFQNALMKYSNSLIYRKSDLEINNASSITYIALNNVAKFLIS